MAVFEVTDRTILKILVRRGLDEERKQARLDEGEIGYTIDSKRLFVGDGLFGGGNVAGNLYQGQINGALNILDQNLGIQYGDFFYDNTTSALYVVNDETATTVFDVGPRYEPGVLGKNIGNGFVRILEPVFGKFNPGSGDRKKAFHFSYDISEPFYGTRKVVEFNTDYWAISSRSNFNPANVDDGYFYFGDIKNVTPVNYKLNDRYKLNVDVSNGVWDGGLIVFGTSNRVFSIGKTGAIGNTLGITDVIGLSGIAFYTGITDPTGQTPDVFFALSGVNFNIPGGTLANPRFTVNGYSKFNNSVAINNDLTVYGNITALGDFSVIDTILTVASALSVINANNQTAFTVIQDNPINDTVRFYPGNYSEQLTVDGQGHVEVGFRGGMLGRNQGATLFEATTSLCVNGGIRVRDPVDVGETVKETNATVDVSIDGWVRLAGQPVYIDGGNNGIIIGKNTGPLPSFNGSSAGNKNTGVAGSNQVVMDVKAMDLGAATSNSYCGLRVINTFNNTEFAALSVMSLGSVGTSNHMLWGGGYNSATGTTSRIYSNGDFYFNGTGTVLGQLYVTGAIYCNSDITAYYASDRNLKTNITTISSALDKVMQIEGVTFDWNNISGKEGREVGVIAQDVEKVLPEVVATRADGYKAVRYEKLTPLLLEAIKELKKEIEELKQKSK
jgi:hypothetical protein